MKIRERYVFSGYVQGVGFRFRAYHAANLMGLTGWVRNEYDGSVTMEIQGKRDDINSALDIIRDSRFIEIENCESERLPVDPDESSFQVLG